MARLTTLLRLARRSDSNRAKGRATKAGTTLQVFVTSALGIVLVNLLYRSGFGPMQARSLSAHQLWFVLMALLLFLPLGTRSSFQPSILLIRPINQWTLCSFRVACIWMSNQALAALVLAFISLLVFLRLPYPEHNFMLAGAGISAAILLSTSLALSVDVLQQGFPSRLRKTSATNVRQWPIFRKDLQTWRRLLDPWVNLLFALLVGMSEISGHWIGASASLLLTFICAVLCLPLFLLPFGLDTTPEQTRQKLLPLSITQLLWRKHIAAVFIFLVSCLPLSLAICCSARPAYVLLYVEELMGAAAGLMIAGAVFSVKKNLTNIRLSVGVFAGNQLPVAEFVGGSLLASVPTIFIFLVQEQHCPLGHILIAILLVFLASLYRIILRRSTRTDRQLASEMQSS